MPASPEPAAGAHRAWIPCRIVGAEPEKPVFQPCQGNVAAHLCVRFVTIIFNVTPGQILDIVNRIVRVQECILHGRRIEVSADGSMKRSAARFRNNLDDSAARMSVLRLESAGLDLNFLHEREVDARTERAIGS